MSVEKDREDDDGKNIDKLRKTEAEGNCFLPARVPVVKDGETGESILSDVSSDGALKAARLPGTMTDNSLTRHPRT